MNFEVCVAAGSGRCHPQIQFHSEKTACAYRLSYKCLTNQITWSNNALESIDLRPFENIHAYTHITIILHRHKTASLNLILKETEFVSSIMPQQMNRLLCISDVSPLNIPLAANEIPEDAICFTVFNVTRVQHILLSPSDLHRGVSTWMRTSVNVNGLLRAFSVNAFELKFGWRQGAVLLDIWMRVNHPRWVTNKTKQTLLLLN